MKINDLTQADLEKLDQGKYVVFNEIGLVQTVVYFSKKNMYHKPYSFSYVTVQGIWEDSLVEFQNNPDFKNTEIFPIEQIKKPIN